MVVLAVKAVPGTPHISEDQDVEKELFWGSRVSLFSLSIHSGTSAHGMALPTLRQVFLLQ